MAECIKTGSYKRLLTLFGNASGATILEGGPTDNAQLQAQVTAGHVTGDVIDATNIFAAGQCSLISRRSLHPFHCAT